MSRALLLLALFVSLAAGQAARKKVVIVGLPQAAIVELKASAPANMKIVAPAPDAFAAELSDANALITPQLLRDHVRAARQLEWVQILNAGVEDAAPLLRDTHIALTSLKGLLGPEVADHAMALLLALTRGLNETIAARGRWEPPENVARLTELRGRTAVIVGVGGIGTEIAQRACGFGMKVVGVDPNDTPRQGVTPGVIHQMVKPDQLDAVLPSGDVVFVTVPDTPATRGMIGAPQFREMKRGAYFIAVSRGAVYSMDGLVEALKSKRLAGAGVDVTDPEPLPRNHPLWKFANVVVTPHIAGASDQSIGRVVDLVKDNIARFAKGEELRNRVDLQAGY